MTYQDLKELHPFVYSFCQLLACFDLGGSPTISFWRACSPKRKWSSRGAIFDTQPEDALIPHWLLNPFKTDTRTVTVPDIPAGLQEAVKWNFIKVVEVKGIQQLALGNAWRWISDDISTEDRRTRLFELLSVFVHGYPEPYTELLCEEVTAELSEVTEASCIPVLSVINRHDFKEFLELVDRSLFVSYLVSFLQFVIQLLSIRRNSQPRSLQALILDIIELLEQNAAEIPIMDIRYARLLRAIQELTSQLPLSDKISSDPVSLISIIEETQLLQSYDERLNATIGLGFSSWSHDIRTSSSTKVLRELCAKWRPISENSPSPMEIFTVASISTRQCIDLWLPNIRNGDLVLRVLTARLMAQNNFYPEAGMLLEECLPDVGDQFGSESFEMSVVLAELIDYLNILDNAEKGEKLVYRVLGRRRHETLRDRTDRLYLKVAVADSLISVSRYGDAQQLLREVMTSFFTSDSLFIKAALRLAKLERRHGRDDDPLRIGSPLSEIPTRISSVSEELRLECIQELACALSIIRDKDKLGNRKLWAEKYNAVSDILERMVSLPSASWDVQQNISTSSPDSPKFRGGISIENSIQKSSSLRDQELEGSVSHLLKEPISNSPLAARALHVACKSGFLILVQSCLLITPVDARWKGKTALQVACENNREALAKLLLKKGADVNAQGGYYGNALQAASLRGHEAIVKLLLKRGADVNAQCGDYGNALQVASNFGHEAIVELLLKRGADVNAEGGYYGTALQAASDGGNETIVELLLKRGADVNAQGGYYGNALQAASAYGHEAIVELLHKRGADVNAQGGYYGNALQASSNFGQEAYVELLLNRGADVNAQGGHYDNALQAASARGREAIVKVLLKRGADVNAQGGHYGSALQAASAYGHEAIVELLLNRGADVNAQCGDYGNALQAASACGYRTIFELLLKRGADVNAQGGYYRNALQAASARGHEALVEALLKRGADVNAQCGDYGNALQAASASGHEDIVELLLKRGADVNAQGGHYGSALQAASTRGYGDIVELLLKRGADVNAQSGYYGSALQAASARGHEAIVELLLKRGADVNVQGGHYGNALQAASVNGDKALVKVLLKRGADINAEGGYYGNALEAASACGHSAIVKLLSKKG